MTPDRILANLKAYVDAIRDSAQVDIDAYVARIASGDATAHCAESLARAIDERAAAAQAQGILGALGEADDAKVVRPALASIVHAGLGESGPSNARRDLARVALRALAAV